MAENMNWYGIIKLADLLGTLQGMGTHSDVIQFISTLTDNRIKGMAAKIVISERGQITLEELQQRLGVKEEGKYRLTPEDVNFIGTYHYDPFRQWLMKQLVNSKGKLDRSKTPHIYDWIRSQNDPGILQGITYEQAAIQADQWMIRSQALAKGDYLPDDQQNIIKTYDDGWRNGFHNGFRWIKLQHAQDVQIEGKKMDHCVGSYCEDVEGEKIHVYSLRDTKNEPVATLGFDSDMLYAIQIKGYHDNDPIAYKNQIVDLLGILDIKHYESSEMYGPNYGLIDIAKIDLEKNSRFLNKMLKKFKFNPENVPEFAEKTLSTYIEKELHKEDPEMQQDALNAIGKDVKFIIDIIFEAINRGHLNVVKFLLENGASVVWSGSNMFMKASQYGHIDIVKYLVEEMPPVWKDEKQNSILMQEWKDAGFRSAINNNHIDLVKLYIDEGSVINPERSGVHGTPLMLACKHGWFDMVKLLVEHGAEINLPDKSDTGHGSAYAGSNQPLASAARNGNVNIIKYLLENGADIHTNQDFALSEAVRQDKFEAVKILVEYGANIHANNKLILGPDNRKIIMYLIEKGIDIHTHNDHLLRNMISMGHLDIVKYLVEHGANVNTSGAESSSGRGTPLTLAATRGRIDIVEYLLQHGAKITLNHAYRARDYNQYEMASYLEFLFKKKQFIPFEQAEKMIAGEDLARHFKENMNWYKKIKLSADYFPQRNIGFPGRQQ